MRGTVSGAQGIQNVTVLVNGEEKRTVSLTPSPAPSSTFSTTVSLSGRVNEIRVVAEESSHSLKLDSDGLPDVFEEQIGTDPLDADSDLPDTTEDEGENGIIDGKEDFDDDGLTAVSEYTLDTDPTSEDTDGDSLNDRFEAMSPDLDPLSSDSDGDGVNDAEEDTDNDGLNNLEEQNIGTSPSVADSDSDGLSDSAEIEIHSTDPLDDDSDNDTLLDGGEITALGTDPLDSDTDDDGVRDPNETYTTTAEAEYLGAEVDMTGEGNIAKTVSIGDASNRDVIFGEYAPEGLFASEAVNLDTDREFEEAEITLEYDESKVDDESSLAMFRYNSTSKKYERLDSAIDESNNTVTATTDEFSPFIIFNLDRWREVLNRVVPSGVENSDNEILAFLPAGNNYAYGTITLKNASLDESAENVAGADGVDNQGNKNPPQGSNLRGHPCSDDEIYRVSDRKIDFNLDTCGFDDGFFINYNILGPDPSYEVNHRSTTSGIVVEGRLAPSQDVEDSDGDGIPDSIEEFSVEEGGLPLHNGPKIVLDPNDEDTDNDGLLDGEEVNLRKKYIDGYEWFTDPTDPDTDDDGSGSEPGTGDDGDEVEDLPSDPRAADVIDVFPATDEEFRDQHDDFSRDGYSGYKGYVERIIYNTNDALEDEFRDEDPTPHLVITTNDQGDWGEWDNQPAGFTTASKYVLDKGFKTPIGWVPTLVEAENVFIEQNQMRGILEWPVDRSTGDLDRRGADVLSGFSGQPMADPEADPVLEEVAGQFIDAASGTAEGDRGNDTFDSGGKYDDDYELTGGVTIIGTDDPATTPETVDNYYLHELGHVLGAIHPKQDADESEFEVPSGEPGVMCKESCKVEAGTRITAEVYINTLIGRGSPVANFNPDVDLPTGTIFDSYRFSDANKYRILNLDDDYKDDSSDGQPEDGNEARNLTSVATAATE